MKNVRTPQGGFLTHTVLSTRLFAIINCLISNVRQSRVFELYSVSIMAPFFF